MKLGPPTGKVFDGKNCPELFAIGFTLGLPCVKYQLLETQCQTNTVANIFKTKMVRPKGQLRSNTKLFLEDEAIQHPRNMLPTVTSQRAFGEDFWIVSKSWLPGETKFCWPTHLVEFITSTVKTNEKKVGYRTTRLSDLASPVQIG